MLKECQMANVVWASKTKAYYEDFGYVFTKSGEIFTVKTEELIPSAQNHVVLICDRCGKEFTNVYNRYYTRHVSGKKDYCSSCIAYEQHKRQRAKDIVHKLESATKLCTEKGYEPITTGEEMIDKQLYFRYKCPEHGEQLSLLNNFLKGHGCYQCGRKQSGEKQKNSPDYVESYINAINGNKLLNKEEYKGSNVHNLRILCGKCGTHEYVTSFSDFYNCNVQQCRSCSSKESVGEKLIADHLDKIGIKYIREKKFDGCKDQKKLPFDFYLPSMNVAIEFDGAHHYRDVFFEGQYKIVHRHDEIKNEYCAQNGIRLLRIPYWDGHNIDNILEDALGA